MPKAKPKTAPKPKTKPVQLDMDIYEIVERLAIAQDRSLRAVAGRLIKDGLMARKEPNAL